MPFYSIVAIIFFFAFIIRAKTTPQYFQAVVWGALWPMTLTLVGYGALKFMFSDDSVKPTRVEEVIVVLVTAGFLAYYFFG